eukprot:TRINITY_DN6892_c0_g1_i1.p1 TRINITY_DN6892_c0_g1~~TRINITY_DN6892_c0_g1_i1.p1  ORF type:complete len:204 (-),score=47.24 TRINITY_DN6892_c0_g1_i1:19-600(-)
MGVETPPFTLVSEFALFCVRYYAPQIRAEVSYASRGREDLFSGAGFDNLAGFIFGNNRKPTGGAEKIAMTAPVLTRTESPVWTQTQTTTRGAVNTMSFVMPSKYRSLRELPQPVDASVRLVEVPAQTVAVITFPGVMTPDVAVAKEQELRAACASAGVAIKEDSLSAIFAQYNPPWTHPAARTNEVMIPLKND